MRLEAYATPVEAEDLQIRQQPTPTRVKSEELYPGSEPRQGDNTLMYIYRQWTPDELRSVVSELPLVTEGGPRFWAAFQAMINLNRPTIFEIYSVLRMAMGPKWHRSPLGRFCMF